MCPPSGSTPSLLARRALLVAALSLLMPAAALAHELDTRHRAIASVRVADGGALAVDVLLMMEIPRGTRATQLMTRFDLDRSGELGPIEAQAMAAELGPEAVGGYVLRHNGKPQAPSGMRSSAATTREGGLAIALLMDYRLVGPGRISVEVLSRPAGGGALRSAPISVELQAEPPLQIAASASPAQPDAPVVGPIEVKPGGEGAWFEVRPKEAP